MGPGRQNQGKKACSAQSAAEWCVCEVRVHGGSSLHSQVAHMEEEEKDVGGAIVEEALPLDDRAKLLLSSNLWVRTGQGRQYNMNS